MKKTPKIKLFRYSGLPVAKDHLVNFKNEFRTAYQQVEDELGKATADNAEAYTEKLAVVDQTLREKFPIEIAVHFPNSISRLRSLMKEHNTAICFALEEDKIVAYLLDNEQY